MSAAVPSPTTPDGAPLHLHILHKLPTPYTDEFYRFLAQEPRVRLQVHHLWPGTTNRPWKSRLGTGYANRYMKVFLGIDWRLVWLALRERDAFFLINDWGHLASLMVIAARVLRRAPVGMWTDTPQEQLPRPAVKRWARQLVLNMLLPRLDVIFATGEPGVNAVREMGVAGERIINLPIFIDLDAIEDARTQTDVKQTAQSWRARVGCAQAGTVFAMAGQLTERKGFHTGITAFWQCAQRTASPVGLLIAGDGPQRKEAEALVDRLALVGRVLFLGWIEPEEMSALYEAIDVLVHPARWEPYGLVVVEAMGWGKPVIGSDASASVGDRIETGKNGFSFFAEDADTLAEYMFRLAAQPDLRASIGAAARATAEEWPMERGLEILLGGVARVVARRRKRA